MPVRNVAVGGTPIKDPISNRNSTRTALSTNIYIAVDGLPVAAVRSMSIREGRNLKMIDEVGTDGHIDSAPNSSTNISGSCQRVFFDGKGILEAFRRGYVHVSAQRTPFDIQVFELNRGSNETIVKTIENVWIESLEVTYNADDFVIVQNMSWQAESINSSLNGTGASAIKDPSLTFYNPFELQADTGLFRGALDAAGLLNAFDGSQL
jgi:hypothetical protein